MYYAIHFDSGDALAVKTDDPLTRKAAARIAAAYLESVKQDSQEEYESIFEQMSPERVHDICLLDENNIQPLFGNPEKLPVLSGHNTRITFPDIKDSSEIALYGQDEDPSPLIPPVNGLHLCVGFYNNGDFKTNTVRKENLAENIEYNRKWRPGRFYFVDGEHVCGGMLKESHQTEFIKKCRERMKQLDMKPARYDTAPYE